MNNENIILSNSPKIERKTIKISKSTTSKRIIKEDKKESVASSEPQPHVEKTQNHTSSHNDATLTEPTPKKLNKTKKQKNNLSDIEKKNIWDAFKKDMDNKELNEISVSNLIEDEQIPEHPCVDDTPSDNTRKLVNPSISAKKQSAAPTKTAFDFEFENPGDNDNDLCYACKSVLIIMEDGFPTCTNNKCGIIYRHTLDYSPEWRYFGADDKNANDSTRCGNPINPLLQESSFGCKVLCSSKSSYEMKKIRKWTEWQSMPHKEKSLYDVFQYITVMAQNSGIPKIFIDEAMVIYKDISEQKIFRGLNRDGIKAASIYISCRLNGCPRTSHEISEIFKLDKASATNGCSMAMGILNNLERNDEHSQKNELCSTTPSMFIERYCSKLNIPSELMMLSKFVATKLEKMNCISHNTPYSIAAGIIYFIAQNCNLNISKMDIKQICGVSEPTINKCYKKMEAIKDQLIPSCILQKYL